MPGRLGLSHVSRHARREDGDKLSGWLAGQHGNARVPARLAHALALRDRDTQRVAIGRRNDERSRRDIAHLTAANDRIGGVRAHSDDRSQDRDGEKQGKKSHVKTWSKGRAAHSVSGSRRRSLGIFLKLRTLRVVSG